KPTQLMGADVAELLADGSLPIKRITKGRPFDPAADALITEPLAGRAKLRLGDAVTLASPTGPRRFTVFGIIYDFGSERGQVMLDRAAYAAAWRDPGVNSLHVRLRPGDDPDRVAARWGAELRRDFPVVVNSFGHVRAE